MSISVRAGVCWTSFVIASVMSTLSPASVPIQDGAAIAGDPGSSRPDGEGSQRLATGRRRIEHTVERGDTLSELAREYGVTVEDIRRWNDLESDFIRVGQDLVIRTNSAGSSRRQDTSRSTSRSTVTYIVERGDTVSRIAARYDVSVDDLNAWNPDLEPDRIRAGQELQIRVQRGRNRSSSIGRPNRGRLSMGEQLQSGPGFRVRNASRSWGTRDTVRTVEEAFNRMHRRYPNARTLPVGDLSYQRGGRMRPHASHQSGRDVDIAYYTVEPCEPGSSCTATPQSLDVRLTWYLLKSFLDTGAVQYIFINWELQEVLYNYVRQRGASAQELETWFQYPRRNRNAGVIRHARGHDDHFHLRFRCSPLDNRCVN